MAAGIITLDQSLGIIIGANVGTTVTGQIIRLLDVEAESGSILRFFQPSTLAPLALIIGVALLMFFKFSRSDRIGGIAGGFGILFSGLLNMTSAVNDFANGGFIEKIFMSMGDNPIIGYIAGAGVAFILQSSSATVGILQAFSMAWHIPFRTIYIVIVGVYLGDCVTTAIVCSIGAKPDAKRVGLINILYNLSKSLLVIIVVTIIHHMGLLDSLWTRPLSSGGIANTNTVFNLACAIVLLPAVGIFRKLSFKLVKEEPAQKNKYEDKIAALNPVFFSMPAIALNSCYDVLNIMQSSAYNSIDRAFDLITDFNEDVFNEILEEEENIDMLTDKVDNYLVQMSPHITEDHFIHILTQYHKLVSEFEHLGDYADKMADAATTLHDERIVFSPTAMGEIELTRKLINEIIGYSSKAFEKRDIRAAYHIEPCVSVLQDLVSTLHDNHLVRLREGHCTVRAGVIFSDILSNVERIGKTCSNIGIATIARVSSEVDNRKHSYTSSIHQGKNEEYNREYELVHNQYYDWLSEIGGDEEAEGA